MAASTINTNAGSSPQGRGGRSGRAVSGGAATSGPEAPPRVTPSDLAELMAAFNEVTARLEASHQALREEVARLTRDLREANEQLERSRRLAALGEMAAGIAHEVRNPLGGVRLYARMLEEDLADRPAQRDMAVRILRASKAVEEVVRDVLTFARELRVRREPVEIWPLLDRALEDCRHDGVQGWRGVEVFREGAASDLVASCDASLLCQAMTNIIRNAFEAMAEAPAPSGGHRLVVQALPPATRGRRAADPGVVIRVIDTGPGVSPEVVARMFNPFFTTRSSGTGLGLAIVHRIIDAHGGRVSVRPREGGPGTEVEVTIGCTAGRSNRAPAPAVPAAAQTRQTDCMTDPSSRARGQDAPIQTEHAT